VDITPAPAHNFFDRFIQVDLSDPKAVRFLFADIENIEGHLDALVNNAAIQLLKPLLETEPEEWDHIMGINVRAVYLTIKYAHPLMRIQGGSIVNISSIHAVATSENLAAYVSSKGALTALTRAAALELARDGIRVNAILPGAIDTAMLRSGLWRGNLATDTTENRILELGKKHSLGRIGKPEEIGETVVFLSDQAKSGFITGQSIIVDGGATARLSTE
jgi:NAD(P)-dependent dehydrogenase (short-subunit alcohol dehydrogenase family)